MDDDASDIDGDDNSEENEVEEELSTDQEDTVENEELDSFESQEVQSETPESSGSKSSLNKLRDSALLEEKRWKGIDEKFLSSGLRLLHLLPILSILLIALTRTFRDISPFWWSEFVNADVKFSVVIGTLSIVVLFTYFAALCITIRKIRSTLNGVKIETDLREIDGQDFRAVHGHSSLIATINSVYKQHIATAFLVFISIIFLISSILSSDLISEGNIWPGTLMTTGTACLLFGYGAHLLSLRPNFNTVNPYGLLGIYSPPVHPALLDFPFRDVIGTHIDPLLSTKLSDFIHSLSENIVEGNSSIEMQERILHLLYLEQYCGLKKNDVNNALKSILSDEGIERMRGNEHEPWDETWRELIDNARSRVKPYFRLHDRILHNAMDISDGKRPPGGLWFDIDIENLIEEGEAHLFTFIHNGTLKEKELVVRIQTPDFSPTETHYSLHLPPGSVEKMTASESSADVKSYMGDLFQESRFIWQTLLPRQRGEATVTVRLEDKSGNLLSGKVATVQIQYDMSRRLRWWAGFVSICTGGAAILWLLILPILGFIGGF
ncbi:MAG: hypothetical protein VX439_03815 [Candidatus Thermoplasmatota archaeon]|nr:hypothetical protein [Candidatus Thermoplasmatota archaeon]